MRSLFTLFALLITSLAFGQCISTDVSVAGYDLSLEKIAEHASGDLAGQSTYRLYIETPSSEDVVMSIAGDDEFALELTTTTTFYQSPFGSAVGGSISPDTIAIHPEAAYDSYVTIGATTSVDNDGGLVSTIGVDPWEDEFEAGNSFAIADSIGGAWFIAPPSQANTIAGDDNRVLVAQLTTDGVVSGQFVAQIFPGGFFPGADDIRPEFTFGQFESNCGCTSDQAVNYDPSAYWDDNSCVFNPCFNQAACNFDPALEWNEGPCEFPETGFDCNGICVLDEDNDGLCDFDDDCIGAYDACGICNGPGEIYACGCVDLPEGSCDCLGNQLDVIGVCGGTCDQDDDNNGVCDNAEIFGCMYHWANNFNSAATRDDGSCESPCVGDVNVNVFDWDGDSTVTIADFLAMLAVFGDVDVDSDGVWDSSDLCVDINACNYTDDPSTPCQFLDVLGVCGGGCEADEDSDGVCDDIDDCIGVVDECGVCNGPGPTQVVIESIFTYFDSVFLPFDEVWFVYPVDADTTFAFNCGVQGCTDSSACNYDASATFGDNNVFCDYLSCPVFGCMSPFACNFNPNAVYNDGSCDFSSCAGCTLSAACNYDPEATFNNGSCDFISCRGCTDPDATNYDPDALIDDGSCEIMGCTNSGACNFDSNATVNDGSCDFLSCLPSGCLLTAACNYDPTALVAGVECIFPEDGYDCDGNCLNDTDGDGVCNPFEVLGCDDPNAFNYNPLATENNGTCVAVSLGCLDALACNYAPLANTGDESCDFESCVGCIEFFACNFDSDATVSSGDCVFAEFGYNCDGECLIDSDGDGVCNQFEVHGCTDETALNYDPEATEDNGSCVAVVSGCSSPGACNYDPAVNVDDGSCESLSCLGCIIEFACNYDSEATQGDSSCEFLPCLGLGCTLGGACNYNEDALVNDGSCEFQSCQGCQTEGACNFDPAATLVGFCDFTSCAGCMDPNAYNYDENATIEGVCVYTGCTIFHACNYDDNASVDDGSCDLESCAGCQIEEACNYDPDATLSGDCTFPVQGYDCSGFCLYDTDEDGVCDEFETGNEGAGCTDPSNPGYNQNATEDDGSCFVGGCLLDFACNYDPDADFVDLSTCEFDDCVGCMDATACNFDPEATLNSQGSCTFPLNQFLNCDGVCNNDTDGDGICDEFEIPGCMDVAAINFNPFATEDDGSCLVLTGGCVIPFACNYDPNADYYDGSCDFQCLYGLP